MAQKKLLDDASDVLISTPVYGIHHPTNYHSFTATHYVFLPMQCYICEDKVFPFISACICLRCRCFVHRSCVTKKSKCEGFTFKNNSNSPRSSHGKLNTNKQIALMALSNIQDIENIIEKAKNIPKMLEYLPPPGSEFCIWRSILRAIARHHLSHSRVIQSLPANATQESLNVLIADLLNDNSSFPGQVVLAVHTVYLQLTFKENHSSHRTRNPEIRNKSLSNSRAYLDSKYEKRSFSYNSTHGENVGDKNDSQKNSGIITEKESDNQPIHCRNTVNTKDALLHAKEMFDTVLCAVLSIIINNTNLSHTSTTTTSTTGCSSNNTLFAMLCLAVEEHLLRLNFDILYNKLFKYCLMSSPQLNPYIKNVVVMMSGESAVESFSTEKAVDSTATATSPMTAAETDVKETEQGTTSNPSTQHQQNHQQLTCVTTNFNANYELHSEIGLTHDSSAEQSGRPADASHTEQVDSVLADIPVVLDPPNDDSFAVGGETADDIGVSAIDGDKNIHHDHVRDAQNNEKNKTEFELNVADLAPLLSYYDDTRLLLLDPIAIQMANERLAMNKVNCIVQLLQQINFVFTAEKVDWNQYTDSYADFLSLQELSKSQSQSSLATLSLSLSLSQKTPRSFAIGSGGGGSSSSAKLSEMMHAFASVETESEDAASHYFSTSSSHKLLGDKNVDAADSSPSAASESNLLPSSVTTEAIIDSFTADATTADGGVGASVGVDVTVAGSPSSAGAEPELILDVHAEVRNVIGTNTEDSNKYSISTSVGVGNSMSADYATPVSAATPTADTVSSEEAATQEGGIFLHTVSTTDEVAVDECMPATSTTTTATISAAAAETVTKAATVDVPDPVVLIITQPEPLSTLELKLPDLSTAVVETVAHGGGVEEVPDIHHSTRTHSSKHEHSHDSSLQDIKKAVQTFNKTVVDMTVSGIQQHVVQPILTLRDQSQPFKSGCGKTGTVSHGSAGSGASAGDNVEYEDIFDVRSPFVSSSGMNEVNRPQSIERGGSVVTSLNTIVSAVVGGSTDIAHGGGSTDIAHGGGGGDQHSVSAADMAGGRQSNLLATTIDEELFQAASIDTTKHEIKPDDVNNGEEEDWTPSAVVTEEPLRDDGNNHTDNYINRNYTVNDELRMGRMSVKQQAQPQRNLDTDELLKIFCSLMVKQMHTNKVHWLAEYAYITSVLLRDADSLLGVEGYTLATLEQCVHCITNVVKVEDTHE